MDPDLLKQAEELGITVDNRWNEATLQSKIDEALAAKAEPKEQTTPVLLLRAYWPEEDGRVEAGKTIDVPVSVARELIKAGIAERADAL